jgi:hypothetical protein
MKEWRQIRDNTNTPKWRLGGHTTKTGTYIKGLATRAPSMDWLFNVSLRFVSRSLSASVSRRFVLAIWRLASSLRGCANERATFHTRPLSEGLHSLPISP